MPPKLSKNIYGKVSLYWQQVEEVEPARSSNTVVVELFKQLPLSEENKDDDTSRYMLASKGWEEGKWRRSEEDPLEEEVQENANLKNLQIQKLNWNLKLRTNLAAETDADPKLRQNVPVQVCIIFFADIHQGFFKWAKKVAKLFPHFPKSKILSQPH